MCNAIHNVNYMYTYVHVLYTYFPHDIASHELIEIYEYNLYNIIIVIYYIANHDSLNPILCYIPCNNTLHSI